MNTIKILTLIAALWNVLPADNNPLRSLFAGLIGEDPAGQIETQADPEGDPVMINMPPPR